ncbi:Rad1-domain-containing protein [Delitschia confertaspora ATCC 74209]|uniref:Rad1-domain-containing protein n=1 Tax=Delitschia confertaspora ATCC 74209 TaxID=1513339 RepID=A0A9P4JXF2_9PLEO|nr:Rad1-domain-containing protein [Delitschia confertaspora ATCC 74209]
MDDDENLFDQDVPIFSAVSSSARQLYSLLRCIGFADKANVQISDEGLRFSVDETSVMEGFVFLDKSLFTTYAYRAPPASSHTHDSNHSQGSDDEDSSNPTFQISLPSLLETLQIFGLTDQQSTSRAPWSHSTYQTATATAFAPNTIGFNNLCRLYYSTLGAPLTVILTESTIRTTCDLTTYEPQYIEDIPFSRQSIVLKIIMRASWLFDAVTELASTNPEHLTLIAREVKGRSIFALAASGPLGSATVQFNKNPSSTSTSTSYQNTRHTSTVPDDHQPPDPHLLETFQLSYPHSTLRYTYKFSLIQKAARAMAVATKVSVRGDDQGVLSLQFMIEGEGGNVSFVEFHFVPLAKEEHEDGYEEEGDGQDRMHIPHNMHALPLRFHIHFVSQATKPASKAAEYPAI